ncbi:MAG: hypothetical protein JXP73_10105 [Deltaproteobacteria bacterium]|nr:hypothetical protein [Deltaproteobacteria bacterium]
MRFLAELAACDGRLGGKARSLAELAAASLPTPAGFVITDDLFRDLCREVPVLDRLGEEAFAVLDRLRARLFRTPWPPGFRGELYARLAALAVDSFAVRSSFAGEDRPGQLAAGVYESRLPVAAAGVEQAIREVLGSALAPGAVAYALAHGAVPAGGPLAVLVHAYVPGSAEGSAAFAPGAMNEPLVMVRGGQLPDEARADIHETLGRLAGRRGPTEIEWVLGEGGVVYLQARPFEPPAGPLTWSGWTQLGHDAVTSGSWQWDASHNPLPLSPAQTGLVEIVDATCAIGVRQRVLGGYLFYAKDEKRLPPGIRCEDAEGYFLSLRADVEAGLTTLGARPGLEEALALFVRAYQPIFGVLQPALRVAHRRLREFLEAHAPTGVARLPALRLSVPSMASERLQRAGLVAAAATPEARNRAVAHYLALFGDEAACWDVAAPTYAEAPAALLARAHTASARAADWQAAAAEVEGVLDVSLHARWRKLLGDSRMAFALGEADDWLYARAQAAVRRALLRVGERLATDGKLPDADEVFYLPLALVREIVGGVAPPVGLAATAAAGRKGWEAALRAPPPLAGAVDQRALRGSGTGGRAIGSVLLHRPGEHPATAAEAVLVARTLLPTELPLVSAVAIVCETGGPLDHVAVQARERSIPAVVGAQGASQALVQGDVVLVDGDRGLVVKLG